MEVDAFINFRPMMEINSTAIEEYYGVIRDRLRERGLFACINRYMKTVLTQ